MIFKTVRRDPDTKRPKVGPPDWSVDKAWHPLIERAAVIFNDHPDDLEAVLASTRNAHYTSEPIVRSMWDAVRRLGFEGGKIIEPGMGTGRFPILGPAEVMDASTYTGIEMDRLTATIAKALPEFKERIRRSPPNCSARARRRTPRLPSTKAGSARPRRWPWTTPARPCG